jgi:mycothiol synthase
VTFDENGRRRVSCEFVVRPSSRGTGVGKMLLGQAIRHAKQQGAQRLDVWAYNDSAASAHLARSFGFRPARRLLHLHRHVGDAPEAPMVEGARIRGFVPGEDDERWLELNSRIFAGHPENGTWRLDDLRSRFAQPWFNADDVLMLEVDGRLRGFCWIKLEERRGEGLVGEIYVIGTAPECRGMGLGRLLLAEGLRRMHERGSRIAAIYVDDSNTAAVSLYETAGFHYHHVDVCYSIDVAAARLPAADVAAAAA